MWIRIVTLAVGLISIVAPPSHAQTISQGFWITEGYDGEARLGAAAAKGVVIYNHGTSAGDSFGSPLPPYMRLVQRAGWDIVRLNRKVEWDTHRESAQALRRAIELLRTQGYARIALAGQSRGAWLNVMAVSQTAGIHAIISTAPGGYGDANIGQVGRSAQQLVDMLRDAKDARVMLFFFAGDLRENVPGGRGNPSRRALTHAGVPALVVNEPADFHGHGAAGSGLFARRYGECILRFIAPEPPPPSFACDFSAGLAAGSDIPLPTDTGLSAAPPGTPPHLAPFVGRWYGEYENGAARRLVVTEILPNNQLRADYGAAGAVSGTEKPYVIRAMVGSVDEDGLVFSDKIIERRFRANPDGTLSGDWRRLDGKPGGGRITYRRTP